MKFIIFIIIIIIVIIIMIIIASRFDNWVSTSDMFSDCLEDPFSTTFHISKQ